MGEADLRVFIPRSDTRLCAKTTHGYGAIATRIVCPQAYSLLTAFVGTQCVYSQGRMTRRVDCRPRLFTRPQTVTNPDQRRATTLFEPNVLGYH